MPEEKHIEDDEGDEDRSVGDELYIQIRNRTTKLENIDPENATISKIMADIEELEGIPVENQMLVKGDGTTVEEPSSTLTQHEIKLGDTLELRHGLEDKWTMWYDTPDPTKKPDPNNWHANVKKIMDFDTVEDFWRLFNNLAQPSDLPEKSNYHLFKQGIMPAWEDPKNAKGGKWLLQVGTNGNDKRLLDEVWLFTALEMIGKGFEDSNEICGVMISLRKGRNKIALWTRDADNGEAMKRLGKQFKEKMHLGTRHKIQFTAHTQTTRAPKPMYEA